MVQSVALKPGEIVLLSGHDLRCLLNPNVVIEALREAYAALADKEKDAVIAEFAGKQFSEFKAALTDLAVAKLGPVGGEMQRLMKDPGHVDKVLYKGAEKARTLAAPILDEVYKTVGFLKP